METDLQLDEIIFYREPKDVSENFEGNNSMALKFTQGNKKVEDGILGHMWLIEPDYAIAYTL
jgi:hypothetical protein